MSDIKVRIFGEFNDSGFKKARKSTDLLGKSFDRLAGKLGAALSLGALVKFSKASIKAFADDDRAAKQLTRTYQNLGMAFESAIVNDYVDSLQRATGVSDSELRPALAILTRSTLDYGKAQNLLNTAMDVSASTGIDLATVSKAIAKAQMGQMSALAKLNVGIATSEAKTLSFDDAITRLNLKFKGSASTAAQSYQGQINRLKVAADEAQESLGRDLVFALNKLSGDQALASIGDKFQKLADNAGAIAVGIASVIGELNKNPSGAQAGGWMDKFNKFMENFNVFSQLKKKGELELTMATSAPTRGGAPGAQRLAEENLKLLNAQKKEQAAILALQKKQVAEQLKQKRLREIAKILAEKEAKFDLQRIQLQAALQGKLTADERNRVQELATIEELKAAIAADDLDKAEALLKQLETLQKQTNALAESLIGLEAGNPFKNWDSYFKTVEERLKALQQQLNGLLAEMKTDLAVKNAAVIAAKTDKATAYLDVFKSGQVLSDLSLVDAMQSIDDAKKALEAAITPEEKTSAQEMLDAANAYKDGVDALTESLSAANLAAALADLSLGNEYLNQSVTAATGLGLIPEVSVNVTVQGNVTTEKDLVTAITDNIYQIQKTGKRITLDTIAI